MEEWSGLFGDVDESGPPGDVEPSRPTVEMPVVDPGQPPVQAEPVRRDFPGHPDPREQPPVGAGETVGDDGGAEAPMARSSDEALETGELPPSMRRPAEPAVSEPAVVEQVRAETPDQALETGEFDAEMRRLRESGVLPEALDRTRSSHQPNQVEQARRTGELTSARRNDGRGGDGNDLAAWEQAQERSRRRAKQRANQRKAKTIQDQRFAVDTGSLDVRYRRGGTTVEPKLVLAVGVLSVLVAIGLVTYLLTGSGGGDSVAGVGDAAGPVADLAVGADATPRTVEELALSTVQLVGLNDNLGRVCAGSGVMVNGDGTILTNAHVVTAGAGCDFSRIGVGVITDPDVPADLRYTAQVLAFDVDLDLAVLRIDGNLDPDDGSELPSLFRAVSVGDSDTVELGDNLRILGFPVIGGDTITFTEGSVSGFTSQSDIGNRALIKTDATIAAGHSGGMAIDADGAVIGIPTKARASESGPAVDCRPLADTNADGQVDDADNCVSVGGFLNGIRPINLAGPLLDEAEGADPIGPVLRPEQFDDGFDPSTVAMSRPRFALAASPNDEPVDQIETAAAGIEEICFFVDWAGIEPGTIWDGLWYRDGELIRGVGHSNESWSIESEGADFWLCIEDDEGLPAGLYEVGFFLEGNLIFAEGIELTPEPVPLHPVTWSNDTAHELCGLAINPLAGSRQVGLDELEDEISIPIGSSVTIDLPEGDYIVEAYDCDGVPRAYAFEGLQVTRPSAFVIGLT